MKVVAVIPARFASTRFPGKPLAKILGKPMIQWVYEAAKKSSLLDRVIVATDDARIYEACRSFEAPVMMTEASHTSGTDRVAEVAGELSSDLIVNIQGDEPMVTPEVIEAPVRILYERPELKMASVARELEAGEEEDPDVVKVWIDSRGCAVYFRRRLFPETEGRCLAHIGIYCYRCDFLLKFREIKPTPAELAGHLEQLRVLDSGVDIGMTVVPYRGVGVDSMDDLKRVESLLRKAARARDQE